MRCLGDHSPKRIAQERSAPEFEACARCGLATDVSSFKTYTIHSRHVDTVGNCVGALNGAPGVVLGCAELRFLGGMPADRSGIKQHVRSLQCGQTSALGIPLVPADERSHAANAGVKGTKAEVAWSEIELFIIKRIVGNVHLAVETENGAVLVESHCRVVIEAGGSFLEERCDEHDSQLFGDFGKFGRGHSRYGLG